MKAWLQQKLHHGKTELDIFLLLYEVIKETCAAFCSVFPESTCISPHTAFFTEGVFEGFFQRYR